MATLFRWKAGTGRRGHTALRVVWAAALLVFSEPLTRISLMRRLICAAVLFLACSEGFAQVQTNPTWWAKLQYLLQHGISPTAGSTASTKVGENVDVSNECGPQSETFITLNPLQPTTLSAGSNDISQLRMRGYTSTDGGSNWISTSLPLPPPIGGPGSTDFGSDPGLAYDSAGTLFYSYIVVFFSTSASNGIQGSELAVARSSDGGRTYRQVTYFAFASGYGNLNDKPLMTVDTSTGSPFRDRIYVAWDRATPGSKNKQILLGRSSDHGSSFQISQVNTTLGASAPFAAVPFVGPNGEVYVAWNDVIQNVIAFNRSFDGGATWDQQRTIAAKTAAFVVAIPAEFSRQADVYPTCGADTSNGAHRGRLYCAWMDQAPAGTTDILLSLSDDHGETWSAPAPVTDRLSFPVDRFLPWLAVDPGTGDVNISLYDTRNDTTGSRYMFDTYFTRSRDGGVTWLSPNLRVSSASSNEHDCNGVYPCAGINYGNQQGDYEGLVSFNGISYPVWTDSRLQLVPSKGCSQGFLMEEVFTAAVK
jgi:hypothetical protein